MTYKALQQPSPKSKRIGRGKRASISSTDRSGEENSLPSTLIEFPGTARAVPEWRKQLSQRVREVQERKAREAAEELAAAQEASAVSCVLPSGQLELVPDIEQPLMNPIVSKALERLERARLTEPGSSIAGVAAATALAPSREVKPKLTVVSPSPPEAATKLTQTSPCERKPVRVISEDDIALSYLDTCLSLPALTADTRRDVPSLARRITAGLFDLLFSVLMISPAVAAINFSGGSWSDPQVLELIAGIVAVTIFAYFTISVALTGRTLAMRMFSLRAIDLRTGLIPTGSQSIKRALAYVFSLAFFGLGLLYALVDPDHRTVHDRFSNTIVIRD